MLTKEDMMKELLRAAVAAVKSLPLEARLSENHAALCLGITRGAVEALGGTERTMSIETVMDGLLLSAHRSGGIILVRPDERGAPIPGEALKRLASVANYVQAVAPDAPAVHLGTTNDGARLLVEAGGVLGEGPTQHRVGLRYCGVDFLAWLDWGHAAAAESLRRALVGRAEVGRAWKAHDRSTADHACPHGAIGGRCCPLPPRDTIVQHEGLRLEVRGDQLRVEADHGDGRRIYRLWQLEDGVLPTAALRLTEALAVQQIAQIAPMGGDPPLGWRHCAADEELVTEVRRAAVATLDPTWRQVEDGAWLLNGLPLGLSAAVHPPDGGVIKYRWEVGVGYDDLAGDEAETLVQAQLCAEAAVLRLVDEAGGALRERHERRRRVAETVQAAPIPEVL